MSLWGRGWLLIFVAAYLVSCANTDSRYLPPDPTADGLISTAMTQAPFAFRIELRPGWILKPPAHNSAWGVPPDCDVVSVDLDVPHAPDLLTIRAVPTGCASDREPLNGEDGSYVALDDARPYFARYPDIRQVDTALGHATVFSQHYTECSNGCRTKDEPVALVQLDDPTDPKYPALMVFSGVRVLDTDGLLGYLKLMDRP